MLTEVGSPMPVIKTLVITWSLIIYRRPLHYWQWINIAGEYVTMQRNNSKNKSHVSHGGIKIVRKLLEIETKEETEKAEKEGVLYTTKKKKICVRKFYVIPSKHTGNGCSSLNNNSRLSQVWYNIIK